MTKDDLPPLPATNWLLAMPAHSYEPEWISSQDGYTDDQMQAYALAAIAAHDAKREKDAERYRFCKTLEGQVLFIQIIRNKGAEALDAAVDDALAYIEREGA